MVQGDLAEAGCTLDVAALNAGTGAAAPASTTSGATSLRGGAAAACAGVRAARPRARRRRPGRGRRQLAPVRNLAHAVARSPRPTTSIHACSPSLPSVLCACEDLARFLRP